MILIGEIVVITLPLALDLLPLPLLVIEEVVVVVFVVVILLVVVRRLFSGGAIEG